MKLPGLQSLNFGIFTFFELGLPGWCQDDGVSSLEGQDDARMMPPPRNFLHACHSRGRMMPGWPQKTRDHTSWPHYVHINDSVIITISWCKAMKSDELFEKCENKWNQWDVLKCDRIIWKSTRNTQNLWKFIRSDERQSNSMEINTKTQNQRKSVISLRNHPESMTNKKS